MSNHTIPSGRSVDYGPPVIQRIRLGVIALFIVGVLVQFYLAGRAAFGASTYSAHKDFGNVMGFVPGAILLLTLASAATRNRVDIIHAVALVVLFEVQRALGDLKHADAGAFHPVNGVLILGVAFALLWRDVRAVRA